MREGESPSYEEIEYWKQDIEENMSSEEEEDIDRLKYSAYTNFFSDVDQFCENTGLEFRESTTTSSKYIKNEDVVPSRELRVSDYDDPSPQEYRRNQIIDFDYDLSLLDINEFLENLFWVKYGED